MFHTRFELSPYALLYLDLITHACLPKSKKLFGSEMTVFPCIPIIGTVLSTGLDAADHLTNRAKPVMQYIRLVQSPLAAYTKISDRVVSVMRSEFELAGSSSSRSFAS